MTDGTTSQSESTPLALPESTDPVTLFVTHGLLSPQLPLAAMDEIASLLQQHGEPTYRQSKLDASRGFQWRRVSRQADARRAAGISALASANAQ